MLLKEVEVFCTGLVGFISFLGLEEDGSSFIIVWCSVLVEKEI